MTKKYPLNRRHFCTDAISANIQPFRRFLSTKITWYQTSNLQEEVSNWINSVSLYGGRSDISPRLISTANILLSYDNTAVSTKINTSNPTEAIENAAKSWRGRRFDEDVDENDELIKQHDYLFSDNYGPKKRDRRQVPAIMPVLTKLLVKST